MKQAGHVVIGFAGDVMLGLGVDHFVSHRDYLYPWDNTLPLLQSTDPNIANLETILTFSSHIIPKVFNFKATPDKVQCLKEARLNLVNLANNHILDYDYPGLVETLKTLDTAGIKHTGAGLNAEVASRPVIMEVKGIKIAVLGFTDNEETWKATESRGGANFINITVTGDRNRALALIEEYASQTDILVVSIHWEPDMRRKPQAYFQLFARELLNHDASIIHGHSAHIFQGVEMHKNKLILYDTGDFIDDHVVDGMLRNDLSFFYLVEVSKLGVPRIKLVPVRIANCQVNLNHGDDLTRSLKKVQELSARFGTTVSLTGEIIPEGN